jgi:Acetyltransferase (GNAT) domain
LIAVMAASDRALPSDIVARPLREDDLIAASALSREVGWNQTEADWRIFLDLGSAICLTRNSIPIATAATLRHGDGFAWISMVIVTTGERRRGLAQWLLHRCVSDLLARKMVPVLDATPAGRRVYIGLGFEDCWPMHRLVAQNVRPYRSGSPSVSVRPIETADWPDVVAYDSAIFGADRGVLLRRLAGRVPAAALLAERDGHVVGYVLGREGRVMTQLGPLVAQDDRIARALLEKAIGAAGAPLTIDVPDQHALLSGWLIGDLGFIAERPLIRMAYKRHLAFDDTSRLFAIAGPELG